MLDPQVVRDEYVASLRRGAAVQVVMQTCPLCNHIGVVGQSFHHHDECPGDADLVSAPSDVNDLPADEPLTEAS